MGNYRFTRPGCWSIPAFRVRRDCLDGGRVAIQTDNGHAGRAWWVYDLTTQRRPNPWAAPIVRATPIAGPYSSLEKLRDRWNHDAAVARPGESPQ